MRLNDDISRKFSKIQEKKRMLARLQKLKTLPFLSQNINNLPNEDVTDFNKMIQHFSKDIKSPVGTLHWI